VGVEAILTYVGVFFGAGTVFTLALLASASDSEYIGSRRNDEVGSA
jgi:hypothetical protein